MEIFSIDAGTFLCDGGGIFGSVPKTSWEQYIRADSSNRIPLAMRCLLVVEGNRRILIETGAGDKLSPEFRAENGIEGSQRLLESLKKAGFAPEDITDVLHTHLHWDHCGGGTRFDKNHRIVLTFPNATYHCSRVQWENALSPEKIEEDSFIEDDLIPVERSGKLNLIEGECELFPGFEVRIFNGHTPGMIVPVISFKNRKLTYITDLVPTTANIQLKWISAFDLYPVTSVNEKLLFLREAYEKEHSLFFFHDIKHECATLKWDEKEGPLTGRIGDLKDCID